MVAENLFFKNLARETRIPCASEPASETIDTENILSMVKPYELRSIIWSNFGVSPEFLANNALLWLLKGSGCYNRLNVNNVNVIIFTGGTCRFIKAISCDINYTSTC